MAQVVERPLWEREASGSSPDAPNFYRTTRAQNVQNIVHIPSRLRAEKTADGNQVLISRRIKAKDPFTSLVPCVNAHLSADSSLVLEVQVYTQKRGSPFYKIAQLSPHKQSSFSTQEDTFARVAIDELLCKTPAQSYRLRLCLSGKVKISFLSVSLKTSSSYTPKTAEKMPKGKQQILVNPFSQMEQDSSIRRRICSPVSLCMALNSLGIKVPLTEVLQGVFDSTAKIYGNWILNIAYAARKGTQSFLRRFERLDELPRFLTKNSRVIASIAFEENELTGAPIPRTEGHLVVICGWKDNQILVADPAAPTADTVLRAYDARQFARVWLKNKQGMSYIVRKK